MFYSQIGQDEFVFNAARKYLNKEKNGTFLDIGCHDYEHINNTYFLEKEHNWKGIGIDVDNQWAQGWKDNRPNSVFIAGDATALDYSSILKSNNMPKVIDYLSLDLEPPPVTLQALQKLFESDYIFNIVTYETDYYRENEYGVDSLRLPSQELFKSKGYILVQEGRQDDYYIHNSLIS
jgi:hypothetical protein